MVSVTEENLGVSDGYDGPLVEVNDLKMHFPVTSGVIFQKKVADVKAVDGVSFQIKKG